MQYLEHGIRRRRVIGNMKIYLVDFFVDGHHVEYAVHLGRYMVEQGHRVTLWTWQPDERLQEVVNSGLDVRYMTDGQGALPRNTFYMMSRFSRGLRYCLGGAAKEQADMIHLLYLDRAVPLPLWWNCLRSHIQIPIAGTLFWPYHFIDGPDLNPVEKLYHWMVRKALKRLFVRGELAALFVHTERIKKILLRTLREGSAERCIVVPDPVPDQIPESGSDSQQACRRRLGLPQERIILLFFGELRDGKGPDILLEATRWLPPDILVIFAGNPKGRLALMDWEQEVSTRALEGRVRLDLGRVPDELVSVYFQAADAVVLPYRRSFLGTSGVLGRATSARKPVIATDVGDIGELVRQYGLGIVTKPEDPQQLASAISQYVRERETIGATVAERAAHYSSQNHWRQTGSLVLEAYQKVLSYSSLPLPMERRK